MIYPDNFEQKIGFDHIRRMLQEQCLSTLGRELIDEISFMTDYDAILTALNRTDEMMKIERSDEEFPTDFFFDVRPMLKRIRIEGTFIDVSELFDLRRRGAFRPHLSQLRRPCDGRDPGGSVSYDRSLLWRGFFRGRRLCAGDRL